MKLSMARVSVSSRRPQTSSRMDFRETFLPIILNQVAQQLGFHEGELNRGVTGAEFKVAEVDCLAVEGVDGFVGLGGAGDSSVAEARPFRLGCSAAWRSHSLRRSKPCRRARKIGKLKRLGKVVVGAGCETFENVFRTAAGGEHQDRNVVARFAECGSHGEAVHAGKHYVEYHGIERFLLGDKALDSGLSIANELDRMALGFEIEAQAVGDVSFVFDYKHATHGVLRDGLTGNSKVTVVPLPSPPLSANTLPPCARATARTMKRPRPVPFTFDSERPGTR